MTWCRFRLHTQDQHSLRPRQWWTPFSRRHFEIDFLHLWILIKISLKFIPRGPIDNIPALSEPMMVSLPTHKCVTRPHWVKITTLWHHVNAWPTKGATTPVVWFTSLAASFSQCFTNSVCHSTLPSHFNRCLFFFSRKAVEEKYSHYFSAHYHLFVLDKYADIVPNLNTGTIILWRWQFAAVVVFVYYSISKPCFLSLVYDADIHQIGVCICLVICLCQIISRHRPLAYIDKHFLPTFLLILLTFLLNLLTFHILIRSPYSSKCPRSCVISPTKDDLNV